MQHPLNDRVLAFAGLFQAAGLVKRTANQGRQTDVFVETCIQSLFKIDADSVESIYNGAIHLRLGLETLVKQMDSNPEFRDIEVTRYAITLLYLEKKLSRDTEMLQTLTKGLDVTRAQADYFSDCHENVIASLAELYQKTISTLTPKIMVTGDERLLQDNENANLIRALLLAGVRSATAWRQCGGNRLQLIFKRKQIVREAKTLLGKLPAIDTMI